MVAAGTVSPPLWVHCLQGAYVGRVPASAMPQCGGSSAMLPPGWGSAAADRPSADHCNCVLCVPYGVLTSACFVGGPLAAHRDWHELSDRVGDLYVATFCVHTESPCSKACPAALPTPAWCPQVPLLCTIPACNPRHRLHHCSGEEEATVELPTDLHLSKAEAIDLRMYPGVTRVEAYA